MYKMILTILFFLNEIALSTPKHSAIKKVVTSKKITISVVPKQGFMTTFIGPWKLELKEGNSLKLPQKSFDKKAIDQKTSSFSFGYEKQSNQWNGEYVLTSFVCKEDKTQCFREVHRGNLNEATQPSGL